ncbi:CLUMA_CG017815, isoform A [Clunio marinus]|uniref:CLUMA_CG017815, isoform A n=1 Tax=Clunio marinus TaxID=568069 RepID=A0A1J1IWU3_9DIPT|nr:CLUMA_CG017815, isoform A [Clunio marinus]
MGVIKVTNAYKLYDSRSDVKVVLKDFNMHVKKGSIYALMGSSGCGKTTLISCIVGTNTLDRGNITVFGDRVKANVNKIGYMPQEISLISEFTINEMIRFFGIMNGMKSEIIKERTKFLCDLLELDDTEKLVRNCSGGQQRRVSFAVALIHEPQLLILDEPTVGVDSLLRSKIWGFLLDITRTKNITVLMTTHYIEEARLSSHVGVMRKGILLAEDTTHNLLQQCNTTSLEEAFLKLSEQQEMGRRQFITSEFIERAAKNDHEKHIRNKTEGRRKLQALLMKNVIQLIRNPGVLFFALILPFVAIICLHNTIGGKPTGLQLGIINDEVMRQHDCSNQSFTAVEVEEYECRVNKISCRFIEEIDFVVKKFYKSRHEAENDAKRGELTGFIFFASNFTEAFPLLRYSSDFNLDYSDDGIIQVYLDNTNLQFVTFLQRKLYDAYHDFIGRIMEVCGKPEKMGHIPMMFETFHGALDDEFKNSIVPGFLVATFFAISSYVTSMCLIDDRRSGVWHRSLVAGANPFQFFLSHLVIGSAIATLQALEFVVYAVLVGNDVDTWRFILLFTTLIILLGLAGILYGLVISVSTDSSLVASYFSVMIAYPFMCLSGVFWPVEGVPHYLKFLSYMLPFTLPSKTFVNIMFTNLPFHNPTIYLGFVVIGGWILGELVICLWFTKWNSANRK